MRIVNYNTGIQKLTGIKEANPNVIVGFSHELLSIWRNVPEFKAQAQHHAEKLQAKTSIGVQANIRGSINGLLKEYQE